MTPLEQQVQRLQAELTHERAKSRSLNFDGGSGTSHPMEGRVSALEVHMEHVREDMAEVKGDLKTVIARLNELPTKRDLDTWRWQWLATGIAIIALTVGGITGGLALIARFAS